MHRLLNIILNKVISLIELLFFRKYRPLLIYNKPVVKERMECLLTILLSSLRVQRDHTFYITGVITSAADFRMLSPVFSIGSDVAEIQYYVLDARILKQETRPVKYYTSVLPLLRAILSPRYNVAITCLDHAFYKKEHAPGVHIMSMLRKYGVRTYCLQHGGIKQDNVRGQASSVSEYQLVWGKWMQRILVANFNLNGEKVIITGNPLHDAFASRVLRKEWQEPDKTERKKILLATCLHSEYERAGLSPELYRVFLKTLYEGIDFTKFVLMIKPHPLDNPLAYKQDMPSGAKESVDFSLYTESSVYELLFQADIVITRASTVAEEAVLMDKQVILLDVVEEGPAKEYETLKKFPKVQTVITTDSKYLMNVINGLSISSVNSGNIRDEIINQITFGLDGESAKRVMEAVTSGFEKDLQ